MICSEWQDGGLGITRGEQAGGGHVERHGKAQHVEQGHIPCAAFDVAEGIRAQAGALCQVFLCEALAFPERADGRPEERARSVVAGTIGAGSFRRCQGRTSGAETAAQRVSEAYGTTIAPCQGGRTR